MVIKFWLDYVTNSVKRPKQVKHRVSQNLLCQTWQAEVYTPKRNMQHLLGVYQKLKKPTKKKTRQQQHNSNNNNKNDVQCLWPFPTQPHTPYLLRSAPHLTKCLLCGVCHTKGICPPPNPSRWTEAWKVCRASSLWTLSDKPPCGTVSRPLCCKFNLQSDGTAGPRDCGCRSRETLIKEKGATGPEDVAE